MQYHDLHRRLVWRPEMRKRKLTAPRFYATQFVLQMVTLSGDVAAAATDEISSSLTTPGTSSSALAKVGDAAGQGRTGALECGLIVESNFRVYAYTRSDHVVLLLNLFIRMEYLLPNLAVGTITKESVSDAFERGISAEQLVRFLASHCHKRGACCCLSLRYPAS